MMMMMLMMMMMMMMMMMNGVIYTTHTTLAYETAWFRLRRFQFSSRVYRYSKHFQANPTLTLTLNVYKQLYSSE